MGTMSGTWPWLMDLSDEEVGEFHQQLQAALSNGSLARATYEVESVVTEWKGIARAHRAALDEVARRKLQSAIDEERRKRVEAEQAWERTDKRLENQTQRVQTLEARLNSIRDLMTRRNDQCVQVDPDEVLRITDWKN